MLGSVVLFGVMIRTTDGLVSQPIPENRNASDHGRPDIYI